MVFVDGVRVNQLAGKLDPREVARINIVKGSEAQAQYGEEAAAGAIHIFTKNAG